MEAALREKVKYVMFLFILREDILSAGKTVLLKV